MQSPPHANPRDPERSSALLGGPALLLRRLALTATWAAGALGLTFLGLWLSPSNVGRHWLGERMKTNASVAIVLGAAAVLFSLAPRKPRLVYRAGALITALACALLGAATLAQYVLDLDLGIDQLIAWEAGGGPWTYPNRMAPTAGVGFILLGVSHLLLLSRSTFAHRAAQLLMIATFAIPLLALIGYLNGVGFLYKPTQYIRISPYTAAAQLLLVTATLAGRRELAIARLLGSEASGGFMARRLLIVAVVVPPALGWLGLMGERRGLYATPMGTSLLVIALILVFGAVFWMSARALEALDLSRRRVEAQLRVTGELTSALARAATVPEVVGATMELGVSALGAKAGGLLLLSSDGKALELNASRGFAPQTVAPYVSVPLEEPLPATDAFNGRAPVLLRAPEEYAVQYPHVPFGHFGGHGAWAAIPLVSHDRALGVLALSFAEPQTFGAEQQSRLRQLADQVAQALDRALLFDSERAARAESEAALQLREEFLSSASHELRTPLHALKLQLHMLNVAANQEPGPIRAQLTSRIERSARQVERLVQLVDRLLDVSRLHAGRLMLEREPLDLTVLVGETLDRFKDQAAPGQLVFHHNGAVLGEWDKLRLDQVVTNLVSNALKYGDGRTIDVSVSDTAEAARVVVRDRGIGISPEDVDRLFGRFERAVPAKSYAGFGLGLWICRELVRAHGGTIQVASNKGEGATFTVELPRSPPQQESASPRA